MLEYKVKFYKNSRTGQEPVYDYLMGLDDRNRAKIEKYLKYLKAAKGYLDEPYSRHIKGKIRELRVDFAHSKHRLFYFTLIGRSIILLHAFLKKTPKTPPEEISKALVNYYDTINNPQLYE